jgi:hypothetical protein
VRWSAGLTFKVFPKTLRLQVGLLTKAVNRRLFYGRIIDLGRKGGQRPARRRVPGSGAISSYAMNVKPLAGSHFVSGRKSEVRSRLQLGQIYERALRKASTGALGGE